MRDAADAADAADADQHLRSVVVESSPTFQRMGHMGCVQTSLRAKATHTSRALLSEGLRLLYRKEARKSAHFQLRLTPLQGYPFKFVPVIGGQTRHNVI